VLVVGEWVSAATCLTCLALRWVLAAWWWMRCFVLVLMAGAARRAVWRWWCVCVQRLWAGQAGWWLL
jgi:hypothetical protein